MTETSVAAKTITVQATYDMYKDANFPQWISISTLAADRDEAEAFVAKFPKSVKLGVSVFGNSGNHARMGFVQQSIKLSANGVHGEKNETGIKRYYTFKKACAKLGITIVMNTHSANSYESLEALEAHL
jgi:hypothetical protein